MDAVITDDVKNPVIIHDGSFAIVNAGDEENGIVIQCEIDCTLNIIAECMAAVENQLDGEGGVYIAIHDGGVPYEGEYKVDPVFETQTLKTNGKTMKKDVTVNAINVSYVSNPQGGETAYIGGEFIHG